MESRRTFFDHLCNGNMLFSGNGNTLIHGSRTMMNMEETSKRRPFFFTAEELMYDEEYYEEPLPAKKRRLTPKQVHLLETSFEAENKLEPERKTELAKKLGMQPRQVAVWFQNRRARWKTKQLEKEYDQLKSSYDSLASNYDSLLEEHDGLKAELLSLTEKFRPEEPIGKPAESEQTDPFLVSTVKVEDRLSMGSDGSAILDDDCPQLLDSGDSYLPNEYHDGCVAAVEGVSEEEDDSGGVGISYHPDEFAATEPAGWFIWT